MMWRDDEALRFGVDVLHRLIPHRRPLLLVDGVEALRRGPRPTLWARRHVSANEPVFDGHFPGLHLWPGIYTIEGLGQSTLVLGVLLHLIDRHEARGGTSAELLEALRDLDPPRWFRTGKRAGSPLDALPPPDPRAGMSGQVDIKLLAPVFAGQLLRYRVILTHRVDAFARFDVEADVDGTVVAAGTLTGVTGSLFTPP
jgi:3-hydroxyacyl-[acyl-carrier-protein] dehydratase